MPVARIGVCLSRPGVILARSVVVAARLALLLTVSTAETLNRWHPVGLCGYMKYVECIIGMVAWFTSA